MHCLPQMELTDTDKRLLLAAQGWLELGLLSEAFEELDNLDPSRRVHPEVLKVRWSLYQSAKKWHDAAKVARMLIDVFAGEFDGWWMFSFAMHEAGHTQEAYDSLVSVRAKFSGEYLLHYNLGCYLARLGRLEEARGSLRAAFGLNSEMRANAIKDPDLKPLWAELQRKK